MRTDKKLLVKGIKFLFYTVALMFLAPIVIYQAFKNPDNILYWPVISVGLILAVAAIAMGFYSIKIILDSLFGKK
jgi:asparagine N-glycosylation enzyme membrane subunit Stt3